MRSVYEQSKSLYNFADGDNCNCLLMALAMDKRSKQCDAFMYVGVYEYVCPHSGAKRCG